MLVTCNCLRCLCLELPPEQSNKSEMWSRAPISLFQIWFLKISDSSFYFGGGCGKLNSSSISSSTGVLRDKDKLLTYLLGLTTFICKTTTVYTQIECTLSHQQSTYCRLDSYYTVCVCVCLHQILVVRSSNTTRMSSVKPRVWVQMDAHSYQVDTESWMQSPTQSVFLAHYTPFVKFFNC
jgi:hypothetical protein